MIMDIIKPDSGEIKIFGEKISEKTKNKLGYLPEERGLYKRLTVMESMIYLASLKGIDNAIAEKRGTELLKKIGMPDTRNKKIQELSKGMGQLIQFVITIINDPNLIILDEPFSGLDPVNTELLKNLIIDLKNQGKTVILSIHQMSQVEELCDRILMIDGGESVLYGNLKDIKTKYRDNSIILTYKGDLGQFPGIKEVKEKDGYAQLFLEQNIVPEQILKTLIDKKITINSFEIAEPTLNEIFLKVAKKKP
jgi:ABC-2 type transport system ATP-binding protein